MHDGRRFQQYTHSSSYSIGIYVEANIHSQDKLQWNLY